MLPYAVPKAPFYTRGPFGVHASNNPYFIVPDSTPLRNRTLLTGADPVALMALAPVNTQPVQNAESTPADDAGAGEPSATPEMAAPAA